MLGNAISYALNQWERLVVYLDDPVLTPDNNMAENDIGPFVLGCKNWLFAARPKGGRGQRPALQPNQDRQGQQPRTLLLLPSYLRTPAHGTHSRRQRGPPPLEPGQHKNNAPSWRGG